MISKNDPNALNNRMGDEIFKKKIQALKKVMMEEMIATRDPLLSTFRKRALQ